MYAFTGKSVPVNAKGSHIPDSFHPLILFSPSSLLLKRWDVGVPLSEAEKLPGLPFDPDLLYKVSSAI